jgi:hypothetical protein
MRETHASSVMHLQDEDDVDENDDELDEDELDDEDDKDDEDDEEEGWQVARRDVRQAEG